MKGQNISFIANLYIYTGKYGVDKYILSECGSELCRHFVKILTVYYVDILLDILR